MSLDGGGVYGAGQISGRGSKRKVFFAAIIAGVVGLIFVAGFSVGSLSARLAAGNPAAAEDLSVEGVATIKLVAPDQQLVGVWTAHNTLKDSLAGGTDAISECLSGVTNTCPNGACAVPSSGGVICPLTSLIVVAVGSCSDVATCGVNLEPPNEYATNVQTPSGCTVDLRCTGWVSSETFTPSELGCTSACTLNDVGAFEVACSSSEGACGIYGQFDDISGASLPTITLSPGDSLAISIQFTVS